MSSLLVLANHPTTLSVSDGSDGVTHRANRAKGYRTASAGRRSTASAASSGPRAEAIDVTLAGQEEFQQTNPLVLAGLVDAEQCQVGFEPRLVHVPVHSGPVLGEMLDGMLGEVVVPGDPIVIEELEQLVTLLQESLSELDRRFGLGLGCDDLLVEAIDIMAGASPDASSSAHARRSS